MEAPSIAPIRRRGRPATGNTTVKLRLRVNRRIYDAWGSTEPRARKRAFELLALADRAGVHPHQLAQLHRDVRGLIETLELGGDTTDFRARLEALL